MKIKLFFITFLTCLCYLLLVSGTKVDFQPSVEIVQSDFHPISFYPGSSSSPFVEVRRESKEADGLTPRLTNPFEFNTEEAKDNLKLTNPFENQQRPEFGEIFLVFFCILINYCFKIQSTEKCKFKALK